MNIDAYRDRDDNGTHPFRVRVDGTLLCTQQGSARRFRTLRQACDAGRWFVERENQKELQRCKEQYCDPRLDSVD